MSKVDYQGIYSRLVEKRRNSPLPEDEYCEIHHIVPRSEGGSDEQSNLVELTAREHYVAHLLLARIYNDVKMWCAVWMMSNDKRRPITSHQYESARKNRSRLMSRHMKHLAKEGRIDKWKYSQLGKSLSENAKKNLSVKMKGNKNGIGVHNISEEGRRKISAANKGKKRSAEFCKRISLSAKGRTPPNKGQPMSQEQKEKLRQANLGKKQSPETIRKRVEKLKGHPSFNGGMKWWNNGVDEVMSRECPEGWVAGRLKSIAEKISRTKKKEAK